MFQRMFQRRRLPAVAAAPVVAVSAAPVASAATAVTVNAATTYQRIDSFGFSQAFGQVAAFRNADGSPAVVALNTTCSAVSVPVTGMSTQAVPHLTNGSNNTAAQTPITTSGGALTSTIPARSPVTYEVRS